jgi:acetyl-CoA carboxylase carboxyltransferase component
VFTLETKIDVNSDEFRKNKDEFLKILSAFKKTTAEVIRGGSEKAVQLHKQRGKLLARERIDKLIDPNTPFLELSPLAAYNIFDNEHPSAGIVTGIGVIHGRETIIIANDATVKGGT